MATGETVSSFTPKIRAMTETEEPTRMAELSSVTKSVEMRKVGRDFDEAKLRVREEMARANRRQK